LYKGAIFFILLLLLVGPIIDQIPSDHNRYKQGIIENEPGFFDKPMLYWVGSVTYYLIGESTFFVIPILSFFFSYMFIYLTFKKKGLNTLYIPILFFAGITWLGSLGIFMRDTLLFLFSSAFLYYMETNRLKIAGVISVLAALTKVGGLLLVIAYIYNILKKHNGFFQAALLPSYIEWIRVNIIDFFTNLQRFPFAIIAAFVNPVISITFLNPSIYTVLYVLAALHVSTLGYDLHHVYRYTLFLMPFAMVGAVEIIRDKPKYAIPFAILLVIANYLWFFFDSETLYSLLQILL